MKIRWNRSLPKGIGSVLILVLLVLAVPIGGSEPSFASEGFTQPAVLLVRLVGFGRDDWKHAHGVTGKRAYDHFVKRGQIHRTEDLSPQLLDRLDSWSAVAGGELLWVESDALVESGRGERLRMGRLPFGPPEQRVHVQWHGEGARSRVLEASRDLEDALWLNRPDVVRWEEVVEILDLTRTENQAFRRLTDEDQPLVQFRSAFLRDKRAASLALYLSAKYRPDFLRLELDLASVFVGAVQPFAQQVEGQVDGKYFAARIRNSMPSVAGRIDRILQSLYVEAPKGGWLIVDARESAEPFVAWLGPDYGVRTKDVVAVLPSLSARTQ